MDTYDPYRQGDSPSRQPQAAYNARPEAIEAASNKLSLSGVTLALIVLNALVFIVMSLRGVSAFSPTAQSVLPWGADYGPLTLNGQWWRMFTSMFIHFGIIHIAFNMFVLANIGPFMEAVSGRVSYSILYLVSGLGGGVASLAWHPTTVSAGASGAIFGLYGGLLGFLVGHRNVIDPYSLKSLTRGALTFVGYNVLFGLTPGIDMAAHMGGLVTGFLLGLFLVQPRAKSESPINTRNAAATLLGVALVVVPLYKFSKPGDFLGEFNRLADMEEKSIDLFNSSSEKWKAHQLSDAQYADIVEKQILPKWIAERDALNKLQQIPPGQAKLKTSLLQYMDTRQESWQLLVDGLRTSDESKITQSNVKGQTADRLAKRISGDK